MAASSDEELLRDVRDLTGYEKYDINDAELRTCIDRAKSHISSRMSLDVSDDYWYSGDKREEALFWLTCFLSKVATGEIGAPSGAVENIEIGRLPTRDSEWYKRAEEAIAGMESNSGSGSYGVSGVTRSNRVYGDEA